MSVDCEGQEVCYIYPKNTEIKNKETQTETKLDTINNDLKSTCECDNKNTQSEECESEDCIGCEHCSSDCDTDNESESDSEDSSNSREFEVYSEDEYGDEEDFEEEKKEKEPNFMRKFKHVVGYFLRRNDDIENQIKNVNNNIFLSVAPLYIVIAFMSGYLYRM